MGGIDVLVVDDHLVVREGLRHLLEQPGPDGMAVRAVGTVADALAACARVVPDVAVVDVMLPDGDGIQLCRELLTRHPTVACLVLTGSHDDRTVLAAAVAGASGYLRKDAGRAQLHDAIRAVARGESLLDEAAVTAALEDIRVAHDEGPLPDLTPQERRVFELVAQGLSNRQVGERLHLSEKTVKNYVSRVLAKLHLDRRTEIAVLSARLRDRMPGPYERPRPAASPRWGSRQGHDEA